MLRSAAGGTHRRRHHQRHLATAAGHIAHFSREPVVDRSGILSSKFIASYSLAFSVDSPCSIRPTKGSARSSRLIVRGSSAMIRTACASVITPSVVPTIQVAEAPSRLAYGKHLGKAQSLANPAISPLAKASPAPDGSTAWRGYA